MSFESTVVTLSATPITPQHGSSSRAGLQPCFGCILLLPTVVWGNIFAELGKMPSPGTGARHPATGTGAEPTARVGVTATVELMGISVADVTVMADPLYVGISAMVELMSIRVADEIGVTVTADPLDVGIAATVDIGIVVTVGTPGVGIGARFVDVTAATADTVGQWTTDRFMGLGGHVPGTVLLIATGAVAVPSADEVSPTAASIGGWVLPDEGQVMVKAHVDPQAGVKTGASAHNRGVLPLYWVHQVYPRKGLTSTGCCLSPPGQWSPVAAPHILVWLAGEPSQLLHFQTYRLFLSP